MSPSRPSARAATIGERTKPAGSGSSHAKVILLGEHVVVHGKPAIALPVPTVRVSAEARWLPDAPEGPRAAHTIEVSDAPSDIALDLQAPLTAIDATLAQLGLDDHALAVSIRSDIPIGRGLGSSAAVAHAIVDAIADLTGLPLDAEERFQLAQAAESVAHGTPSGLDARATAADHAIWFERGSVRPVEVDPVLRASLVIADTGIRGSTATAVAGVRRYRDEHPARVAEIVDEIEWNTVAAVSELGSGDAASFGARMTATHALLRELGVSHPAVERLVEAALANGALGAKVTGGGLGGCVIALAASPEAALDLADALLAAGASNTWIASHDEGRA